MWPIEKRKKELGTTTWYSPHGTESPLELQGGWFWNLTCLLMCACGLQVHRIYWVDWIGVFVIHYSRTELPQACLGDPLAPIFISCLTVKISGVSSHSLDGVGEGLASPRLFLSKEAILRAGGLGMLYWRAQSSLLYATGVWILSGNTVKGKHIIFEGRHLNITYEINGRKDKIRQRMDFFVCFMFLSWANKMTEKPRTQVPK